MLFSASLAELYKQNWPAAKVGLVRIWRLVSRNLLKIKLIQELLSKIIFIWPTDYVALEERAFCYYSAKQKVSALLELRKTEKVILISQQIIRQVNNLI